MSQFLREADDRPGGIAETITVDPRGPARTARRAPSPPRRWLALPQRLGHYELRRHLGSGGMGDVFEAYDHGAGRLVAVKTLHDPDGGPRIKAEFRVVADLYHPNLARMHELGYVDGTWFVAMELVRGVPFPSVRSPPALRSDDAQNAPPYDLHLLVRQVLAGLSHLHDRDLVHGDLKPENVLLTRHGRVVIVDFGLTRPAVAGDAPSPAAAFTPGYAAPEVVAGGRVTAAADMYALGRMLTPLAAAQDMTSLCDALTSHDPGARPSARSLLESPELSRARRDDVAPVLVGREGELDTVARWWRQAREGRGTCGLIVGESGMGKSALLHAAIERVRRETPGTIVAGGRCHERESMPFKALDRVVEQLFAPPNAGPETPEAVRDASLIFSSLRSAALASNHPLERDPQQARLRAFRGLGRGLRAVASRAPLILWIDDLHWSDRDSWDLLGSIFDDPELPPFLALFTVRAEDRDLAPLQAWRERVAGRPLGPAIETLTLGPLDAGAVATLLQSKGLSTSAIDSEGESAGVLPARRPIGAGPRAGDPFLLDELVHCGFLTAQAGPDVVADALSETVRRLPEAARRFFLHAALVGRPVSVRLLVETVAPGSSIEEVLGPLQSARLVRTSITNGIESVELRHGRLNALALADVSSEAKREAHLALARALRNDSADPSEVAYHYAEAGDLKLAARESEQAAAAAAEALAFAKAAELIGKALEWAPRESRRARDLRAQQAEAFANAGAGPRAAECFLLAAQASDVVSALDLRRRAAEQLLASGHLDEGKSLLAPLCEELGVRIPSSGRPPLLESLGLVARLQFALPKTRGAVAPRAVDVLRSELCWTAVKGLIACDTLHGLAFLVLGLRSAVEAGDDARIVRFFALLASTILLPGPPPLFHWGMRLLSQAETLATSLQDPSADALLSISRGFAHLQGGRWKAAVDSCLEGEARARTLCTGVAWELAVSAMAKLRALEEIGRYDDMTTQVAAMLPEARQRGDVYYEATLQLSRGATLIARGRIAEARQTAAALASRWGGRGSLQIQSFYAARLDLLCDLVDGEPAASVATLRALWPALRDSGMLLSPLVRMDANWLRGRVVLRAIVTGSADATLSRDLTDAVKHLEALKRPDARARAALLRAGLMRSRGATDQAVLRLRGALAGFEASETAAMVFGCRRLLAWLESQGGDRPAADEPLSALRSLGVRDIGAWARTEFVGFDPAFPERL